MSFRNFEGIGIQLSCNSTGTSAIMYDKFIGVQVFRSDPTTGSPNPLLYIGGAVGNDIVIGGNFDCMASSGGAGICNGVGTNVYIGAYGGVPGLPGPGGGQSQQPYSISFYGTAVQYGGTLVQLNGASFINLDNMHHEGIPGATNGYLFTLGGSQNQSIAVNGTVFAGNIGYGPGGYIFNTANSGTGLTLNVSNTAWGNPINVVIGATHNASQVLLFSDNFPGNATAPSANTGVVPQLTAATSLNTRAMTFVNVSGATPICSLSSYLMPGNLLTLRATANGVVLENAAGGCSSSNLNLSGLPSVTLNSGESASFVANDSTSTWDMVALGKTANRVLTGTTTLSDTGLTNDNQFQNFVSPAYGNCWVSRSFSGTAGLWSPSMTCTNGSPSKLSFYGSPQAAKGGESWSLLASMQSGLFSLPGNLGVSGAAEVQGAVTGASINGEITVDGTTYPNLNAAWNAAANQATASGTNQTIRLGPGSFPVTATLTEPTNGTCVSVLGSAGTTMNADSAQIATTLTLPASLGGDVFFLGNAAQAQGCTFRDLNVLAAANATHGFEMQWFRGLLIDNVTVNDTTAEGILLGEENTGSGHQASFLLRNATVSYSSAAFTPANRPAYGIHLQKTAMDSHLDDIVVRNALTAAIWNEGTGNIGYPRDRADLRWQLGEEAGTGDYLLGESMKLTIDNHDGKGAVDYSACVVAGRPFRIVRRLNEPVTCAFTLLPTQSLATPARNGRVIVADDAGVVLFTGYVATEPALELAGQGTAGAVYQAVVSAISDDILLSRQPLPQVGGTCGASAGAALQSLLARLQIAGITQQLSQATAGISLFEVDSGRTWAENTGALASATRNAWRLMNGTLTLLPVGSVTHTLSESAGTLSLGDLSLGMVKALANDVTVCGETEACAYVTEYFQGDGTTVFFNLTERPWMPAAAQQKPLIDLFQEPTIDGQLWAIGDPGGALSLTSAGLTCAGGGGSLGSVTLSALSNLELGGGLIIEAANVQFGAQTSGILNGLYSGDMDTLGNCIAGFQIAQPGGVTTISPLIEGIAAGSSFSPASGHSYTLRLRYCANEPQRVLQAYYAVGADNGTVCSGGTFVGTNATVQLEVQDTTNGVAGVPVVLYSGVLTELPPWCLYTLINASDLQCSIGSITIEELGPMWVTSTPPSGTPFVRRLGTAAQGADCTLDREGRLQFYPASTPQAGELIAISYRTSRRSVARLASAASIASETMGGSLPGTACWMGSVLSPAPRSSADCENAATAILALATSRAAAWRGSYTLWNAEQTSDIWPGDVLAIRSASAGVTANVVVRTVEIDVATTAPTLVKYTVAFANDWADALAIRTSSAVPDDAWLPQQPETAPPLANLNNLSVTSINGSQIQISANATTPTGGGFEVRRRDWSFTPGPGPDLVLRSPVPNFSIARQSAIEQYYVRMYDGANPPNYSRFSSAVFVNLPL